MPVPPPWQVNEDGKGWINDITGEESLEHPLKRILEAKRATEEPAEDVNSTALVVSTQGEEPTNAEASIEEKDNEEAAALVVAKEEDETGEEGQQQQEQLALPDSKGTGATQLAPIENENARKLMKASSRASRGRYSDFRCLWKEKGLFGETNSYGLTLRYYEDASTDIRFDGVEGMWVATQLDGPYGPLDKLDLFVGAKIKIFGRHLSINSTGASTTHWIEEEGKRLMKQQNWLQERVESVGRMPVVRRPPPSGPLAFSGRSNKPAGGDNLRMITVNNAKILEQLSTLGMGHCGSSIPHFYTKEHLADSQPTI